MLTLLLMYYSHKTLKTKITSLEVIEISADVFFSVSYSDPILTELWLNSGLVQVVDFFLELLCRQFHSVINVIVLVLLSIRNPNSIPST